MLRYPHQSQILITQTTRRTEVRNAPLTITGESYGGLYTPNLGYIIAQHNLKEDAAPINFAGLAVGDPCINWAVQMPTYPDTMYGMGVIMMDEREELRQIMNKSVSQLNQNCTGLLKRQVVLIQQ